VWITPTGKKTSANGTYRDFTIVFEHAAPRPTTAELLGVDAEPQPTAEPAAGGADDPDIPF
jgi:hypothetical protein